MTASRRFAQGTPVPVVKTRGEIESLVKKNGAHGFVFGSSTTPTGKLDRMSRPILQSQALVVFEMKSRRLRFIVPMPAPMPNESKADEERRAAEERRLWRSLLLVLKAKLEAVASGIVSFDTEFLPFIVTGPRGETVGDQVVPRLAEILAGGDLPRLLGPGTP